MSGGELPLKNDEYINDTEILSTKDSMDENADKPSEEVSEAISDSVIEDNLADDNVIQDTDSPSLLVPDDIFGYKDVEAEFFGKSEEDDDAQYESDISEESAETEGEESEEDTSGASQAEDGEANDTASEESLPEENKKADTKTEEKPRRVDSIFDFIELFVFTLAAVFIITSFFFRYSTVEGGSMMNTLEDGEKLILSSFLYDPKPGDIVVVQDRSTELKDPIVKRVIAVGGQTVKVTPTTIYVDGKALEEDYVYTEDYYNPIDRNRNYFYDVEPCEALEELIIGYEENVYYEILIPKGEIFVMGDHRNNSKDSRNIGTLHEDAIIGKVVLRFYPFDKFGKID